MLCMVYYVHKPIILHHALIMCMLMHNCDSFASLYNPLCFCSCVQHHGLIKEKSSKNQLKISKAERKILIVFCYYVVLSVLSLVSFTISTRNDVIIVQQIEEYFICELNHPSEPCPRTFEDLQYLYLSAVAFVLLSIFPLIFLIVMVNFQELKEKFSSHFNRETSATSSDRQ